MDRDRGGAATNGKQRGGGDNEATTQVGEATRLLPPPLPITTKPVSPQEQWEGANTTTTTSAMHISSSMGSLAGAGGDGGVPRRGPWRSHVDGSMRLSYQQPQPEGRDVIDDDDDDDDGSQRLESGYPPQRGNGHNNNHYPRKHPKLLMMKKPSSASPRTPPLSSSARGAGGGWGSGTSNSSTPSGGRTPGGGVPATPPNPRLEQPGGQHMLFWSFVGMVVFGLGNTIFCKLMTRPMVSYTLFLNVWANCAFVPASFLYILPAIHAGWVSKEDLAVPKYKFAIMGMLDTASAVMSMLAVTYMTSPSLIIILQQAAIPISMGLSRCFLHETFTPFQYAGATLVMLGLLLALIPTMRGAAPPLVDDDPSSLPSQHQAFWEVMMLASNVPACLSSLYKELALGQGVDLDVVYLNGWVALFQLVLTLPAALPSAYIQHMPLSQVPANLWDGWLCYSRGINTMKGDDCKRAPLLVNLYLVFNVLFNITSLGIVKYGGANVMFMASTVLVPLSNLAFTLDFVPGHQQMGPWDLLGLFTIVTGLVVYRFWPDLHQWLVVEVLHRIRARDYRRPKHGLSNINMQHRVFHHLHVPVPYSAPWHRPQYRYASIVGVNVLIAVLAFACGLLIGRALTLHAQQHHHSSTSTHFW